MTLDPRLVAAGHLSPDLPDAGHHPVLTRQTETARHLLEGNYRGVASIAEAFADAWLGLGVIDQLDGEVVVVDGEVWVVPASGVPYRARSSQTVPFAIAEPRAAPGDLTHSPVPAGTDLTALGDLVAAHTHRTVTIRLEGTFRDVVLRSERRQEPPYHPLDQVLSEDSDQEIRFHFDRWQGVMVGYRFPSARDGALVPGIHLHALSADRLSGGHCKQFTAHDVSMTWAPTRVKVTAPAPH